MASWLIGKKTYLLSGLICMIAVVLVFLGRLTPELAAMMAIFTLAGFGVSFRKALQTHQEDVISLLMDVAAAGKAYRQHNVPLLTQEGLKTAQDAATVCDDLGGKS